MKGSDGGVVDGWSGRTTVNADLRPGVLLWAVFVGVATAGVVADQVSKARARTLLPIGDLGHAAGPLFLRRVENPGVAWNALPAGNVIPVVVGALILALLAIFVAWGRLHPVFAPGCALATAGCAGNLLDRLLHGRVTDFLVLGDLPAFNVADVLITVGFVLMVSAGAGADLPEWRTRREREIGTARPREISQSFE